MWKTQDEGIGVIRIFMAEVSDVWDEDLADTALELKDQVLGYLHKVQVSEEFDPLT